MAVLTHPSIRETSNGFISFHLLLDGKQTHLKDQVTCSIISFIPGCFLVLVLAYQDPPQCSRIWLFQINVETASFICFMFLRFNHLLFRLNCYFVLQVDVSRSNSNSNNNNNTNSIQLDTIWYNLIQLDTTWYNDTTCVPSIAPHGVVLTLPSLDTHRYPVNHKIRTGDCISQLQTNGCIIHFHLDFMTPVSFWGAAEGVPHAGASHMCSHHSLLHLYYFGAWEPVCGKWQNRLPRNPLHNKHAPHCLFKR